jgi:hypothetical protein
MNFHYLAFCGNNVLKPSRYIIGNLSDRRTNDILMEFQKHLKDEIWGICLTYYQKNINILLDKQCEIE